MPHHTLCQSLTGLHPPLPRSIKLFHQPLWQFQMCRSWAQGYVSCHLLDWCFLLQRFHLALGLVRWVFHTNPCVSYLYKHFTWYPVSLQARFWFESFLGRVGLYLGNFFFLWWWIEGEGCIHMILFHVLNPVPVSADETANPKSVLVPILVKVCSCLCGISW